MSPVPAGVADVVTAPWPHGPYYIITLNCQLDRNDTDTGTPNADGRTASAIWWAPFAVTIKKAQLTIANWNDATGSDAAISVTDDDGQTFVASLTLDDSSNLHANTASVVTTALTVADEGPCLQGSAIYFNVDSAAGASDSLEATLCLTLMVEPLYAPTTGGTI